MNLHHQITPSADGRSKLMGPGLRLEEVAPGVVDEALHQIVEEQQQKQGAWVFPWEVILAYITHFGDWPAWVYVKRRQTSLTPPEQQGVWSSFLSIFRRAAKQDYHAHQLQTELFIVLHGVLRLWGMATIRDKMGHCLHEFFTMRLSQEQTAVLDAG